MGKGLHVDEKAVFPHRAGQPKRPGPLENISSRAPFPETLIQQTWGEATNL